LDRMNVSYAKWSKEIERFVQARLGDPQLAEEIAQESISRLLAQDKRGVEIENPRAWLFRTARNLAVDVVRRQLPSPLGLEALALLPDRRGESDDGEYDTRVGEVSRSEVLVWIPELMDDLKESDREFLRRRYAHGMSCRELAQCERITVANAKVRLFRARKRLLQAIESRAAETQEWRS